MNITHPQLVKALLKPGSVILPTLTPLDVDLLNTTACICGEAGELFDAIKKTVFYEQELNRANVVEELGDLEFYMEGLRAALDISREETLAANIAKLSERYKELTYSNEAAQARADKVNKMHGTQVCSNCLQPVTGDKNEHYDPENHSFSCKMPKKHPDFTRTGHDWDRRRKDARIVNWAGYGRSIDGKIFDPHDEVTEDEFNERAVFCTQIPKTMPLHQDP